MKNKIKVGINGFGVIGRRVADAVLLQDDMELIGISDISFEARILSVIRDKIDLYASTKEVLATGQRNGINLIGTITDLIQSVDIVVDCTPKGIGAKNTSLYNEYNVKFILQGGEKHEMAGHSFVAESNYEQAIGRKSTRVVSCNTTSIVRTLSALKRTKALKSSRGVILRRSTDPWKSHQKGILNTLVPEDKIPSHQGTDAQTVDNELDVLTMAVMVPETVGHMHYWTVQTTRPVEKEEIIDAFRSSSRLALIKSSDGLGPINTVKELMLDLGRPHGNMYEVAIWENLIEVRNQEIYFANMVDNQAIVIPETIDAIRALYGATTDGRVSIDTTNKSLGVMQDFNNPPSLLNRDHL